MSTSFPVEPEVIGNEKSPPMTEFEKSVLRELILKYKDIVESKETSTGINEKKNKAWNSIQLEFCSNANVVKRSASRLKTCWKNMKQRAKLSFTAHTRSLKKTGGGPPESVLSAEAISVASIIPAQMRSLENPYDCDASPATVDATVTLNDESLKLPCEKIDDELEPPKKKLKLASSPHRKQKDARSSLVDMEYEEHKVRLQILKLEHETAQINKDKAHFERFAAEVEHHKRLELLHAQTSVYYNPQQFQHANGYPTGNEKEQAPVYQKL